MGRGPHPPGLFVGRGLVPAPHDLGPRIPDSLPRVSTGGYGRFVTDSPPNPPQTPQTPAEVAAFLAAAAEAAPGWSEPYGGPAGVASMTPALQEFTRTELTAIRAAALQELTRHKSGGQVARELHLTRQTVNKLLHFPHRKDISW